MRRFLCFSMLILFGSRVFAFGKIIVENRTPYFVKGVVEMMACSDHAYDLDPWKTYSSPNTGICLLTKITVRKRGAKDDGIPYKSSGTDYAHFEIVEEDGKLKVIRP